MRDEDKWLAMHTYRKLVEQGIAPAIVCPDCEFPMTTQADEADRPILVCSPCRVTFNVSAWVLDFIEANIREAAAQL